MKRVLVLFLAVAAFAASGQTARGESVELQTLKKQIRDLEAMGGQVPDMLYQLVETMEKEEAKSGGGSDSVNPYGKSVAEMSCTDDISGTYKSSSGTQTLVFSSGGNGRFQQYSTDGEYLSEVEFSWNAAPSSLTFNYNGDLKYTNTRTGAVEYKARPRGGTVGCEYSGSALKIGGVMYYR